MFADTGYNVSVRNTFLVVQDDDDKIFKCGRRTLSCPPRADALLDGHGEACRILSRATSKGSDGSYSTDEASLAPCEPRPAERLPPRKVSSTYMLDGPEQSSSVPDDSDDVDEVQVDAPPTTMMIRNIPCCCSKQDVIGDIDALGFADSYDFFYLPQHRKSNLGYAFINFTNPGVAAEFRERLQGHRFSSRAAFRGNNSRKACTVSPAVVQGLKENKKHFRRTRVFKSERGPTFYKKEPVEELRLDAPCFHPEVGFFQKHVMEHGAFGDENLWGA